MMPSHCKCTCYEWLHAAAAADCELALALVPTHVKARLRLGTAKLRAEKYEDALTQFDIIIQQLLDGVGDVDSVELLSTARARRQEASVLLAGVRSPTVAAAVPTELLSDTHTKRLYFKFGLPAGVVLGEPFEGSVFVTNEVRS